MIMGTIQIPKVLLTRGGQLVRIKAILVFGMVGWAWRVPMIRGLFPPTWVATLDTPTQREAGARLSRRRWRLCRRARNRRGRLTHIWCWQARWKLRMGGI